MSWTFYLLTGSTEAMRVLFTCLPAHGHFHPLVPLARAAAAAGHDVAFATGEPFRGSVEAADFEAFGAGLSTERWLEEMTARFGDFRHEIPRADHRRFFFGSVFTDLEMPARLTDLLTIADKWQPDLLVHELAELAGPLAAELAGIPHATCGYGPLPEPEIAEIASLAAGRHWTAAGLDPSGSPALPFALPRPVPPQPPGARHRPGTPQRPGQARANGGTGRCFGPGLARATADRAHRAPHLRHDLEP